MEPERPRARRRNLLVRDLGDEVVVYDVESHRGHSLNRTAALVWRGCDGRTTVARIAAQLGRDLGPAADEFLVRFTLQKLRGARLLDPGGRETATLTRRELARRIGRVALLPVVASVLAPRPSEAATPCPCVSPVVCDCTGVPNGPPFTSCWKGGSDCSGYCSNGTCV